MTNIKGPFGTAEAVPFQNPRSPASVGNLNRRGLQHLRRFAEAQRHTGQSDYRTKKWKPVAMAGVERGGLDQRVRGLQRRALIAGHFGDDAAVGIDHRGNAAVGVAQQPAIVLDRTHPRHVEVLMGRAGRAEPSVVGDVHKDGSAVQGELADFAGKNRLVANERSQSDAIFIERIALGAAGEGPNLAGEWLGKADEILKRNEFAEGNKVDFVVAINPGSG